MWFIRFHKHTRIVTLLQCVEVNKLTTIPRNGGVPAVQVCSRDTASFQSAASNWAPGEQAVGCLQQMYQTACSGAVSSKTRSTLQPPTRSNFTTCTHTGNCLPWLGESSAACSVLGQDIQVKERSPKAHPCFQTHGRAPHKAPWPSYTLPEHKMVPTHSAFCPSQAAQQDVTAQERTVDVTAQEITSCYRNIQRDTAGQLVMSAALNHKHFELFWYNGKLWEGEGTSTGQK